MTTTTEECSTLIDSLALSGKTEEVLGVTTFSHEACESVDAIAHYVPSLVTTEQPDLQDLKSYFQRPRSIFSSTALTANFSPAVIEINMANLKSWFPQLSGRLGGVYAWRFKLRFRLQIIATPFHQGVLAMAFQHASNTTNFDRTAHSSTMTNIPHVRLDVSSLTAVELEVPFIAIDEYWPISNDTTTYGEVAIATILPIISVAGQSAVQYNVYLTIEDIELYGAAQWATTSITLQSGVMMQEIKDNHLVSKSLATVAKVSRFLGRGIPSLSAIAGPVAWAADTAAGVARYFGYSRPLVQDPAVRVYRTQNAHENNVDLPMVGNTLGLMSSNTLAVSPQFGATDVDEMALDFLLSRYSQICIGYVSATDTEGFAVYASPVSPSAFWYRRPATAPYCNINYPAASNGLLSQAGNCFQPSHLLWWGSFFRAWRGSVKFRITFAKNKFHAGRYLISFQPDDVNQRFSSNYGGTVAGPELSTGRVQPFGYSMIMDLKDDNVFEFDVPFLLPRPYTLFDSSTGSVTITCIDSLIAPSTCSQIVPFLVEVAGGADFELADYSGVSFAPAMGNYTIYTQSGVIVTPIKNPSDVTIGEKVKSVKQIIQSPGWVNGTIANASTLKAVLTPWFAYIPSTSLTTAASGIPILNTANFSGLGCAGSVAARAYNFARGGTDHHFYTPSSAVYVSVDQLPQTNVLGSLAGDRFNFQQKPLTSTTPKVIAMELGAVHIRCPAFSNRIRFSPTELDNQSLVAFGTGSATPPSQLHGSCMTVQNVAGTSSLYRYARAAADDAALAYYLGPPPLVIPNATQATTIERDWIV